MDALAPAVTGDQIDGCGLTESELAIDAQAVLLSSLWVDPTLPDMPWLDRSSADGQAFYVQIITMLYEGFSERYADTLDPDVRDAGDEVVRRITVYLEYRPEPLTVVHGDFRLDNLLFGGPYPVAAVDWQTVTRGPALTDVAYFMGTSPTPDVRAAHEEALVGRYVRDPKRGVAGKGCPVRVDIGGRGSLK